MSFLSNVFGGASNNFTPQGTAQALTNYQQAGNGLNDLATQLRIQSQGGGPNLANQMLQNATGQNVANQAALQAGQRGASQNVGLMSRQIANQGAQIQQQQAGQASSNRLMQQLGTQQQLGGVLSSQGQLGANVLNVNNDIGNKQAAANATMNQGIIGGIANAGLGLLGLGSKQGADGGTQKYFAEGGMAGDGLMLPDGPSQFGIRFLNKHTQHFAQGGMSQPMQGMMHFAPHNFKQGGQVPGQPKIQGNSPKNDTVPAMLSPQEIVIPNSITQSSDPVGNGAKFIAQVMSGKHRKAK